MSQMYNLKTVYFYKSCINS